MRPKNGPLVSWNLLVLASSLAVITIAGIALLGWFIDSELLKRVSPGKTPMNPVTCTCFFLAAIALGALLSPQKEFSRTMGCICAGLVALVGTVKVFDYLVGFSFHIDQIFFFEKLNGNRLAPNTALALILTGWSLFYLNFRGPARGHWSYFLMLITAVISSFALLGYVFGSSFLYGIVEFNPMAINTATAFILLSLGTLCIRLKHQYENHSKWSLSRNISISFGIALSVLLLVGFESYRSVTELVEASRWASHTREVLQKLNETQSDVVDIETGARGYLVARAKEFLEPFDWGQRSVQLDLKILKELMRDNPAQQEKIAELTESITEVTEILSAAISSRSSLEKTNEYLKEGKVRMDKIRKLIETMKQSEEKLLKQRNDLLVEHAQKTLLLIIIGTFCGIFIIAVAVASINRDIVRRQNLERALAEARDEALESVRAKSEFLANMSHEIRTPMNGVIGMTGLLLDTPITSEQRKFIETIQFSSESLLTVLNDILDFSKIEAGMLNFEIIPFNLSVPVEGSVEILAKTSQAKGVELLHFIHEDVPLKLRGDPGRLRQVLTNLIGNAVKFTEKGEVFLEVKKAMENDTHVTLNFSVKDTGIGISRDAMTRLFKSFSQADTSTTRKYGGTGLGLAISQKLVENMGGKIQVESEIGKGSRFYFTAKFEKQPSQANGVPKKTSDLEGVRVLIVDDNSTNQMIMHRQTASWGMRDAVVSSADEAIRLLRKEAVADPFTIAILDMQMPQMDGFQLARAIKADPLISKTQLIMMSSMGKSLPEDLQTAGLESYLTKPVRPSTLFDCLMDVVNEKNPSAPDFAMSSTDDSKGLNERRSMSSNGPTQAKILVVEDNPINQEVLVTQLKKMGFNPDLAENGKIAVAKVGAQSYDLVFMDCQMPEMDGYEATSTIRKTEGGTRHTTIVAMTAHALTGDREKCIASGMDDYLSKPVKAAELRKILDRWLAKPESLKTAEGSQASESASGSTVVDLEQFAEASNGTAEGFNKIKNLYLTQTSQLLKEIESAYERKDSKSLESAAHKCAGSNAICGMIFMVPLLRELEILGRDNHLEKAGEVLAKVKVEYAKIEEFFKSYQGKGA